MDNMKKDELFKYQEQVFLRLVGLGCNEVLAELIASHSEIDGGFEDILLWSNENIHPSDVLLNAFGWNESEFGEDFWNELHTEMMDFENDNWLPVSNEVSYKQLIDEQYLSQESEQWLQKEPVEEYNEQKFLDRFESNLLNEKKIQQSVNEVHNKESQDIIDPIVTTLSKKVIAGCIVIIAGLGLFIKYCL